MKLEGNVFAVTGGGNGIGREIARQLLARNARVAAIDIQSKALEETRELCGNKPGLSVHIANIGDRNAVAGLVPEILAAHGHVDGIINCAGIIQPFKRLADIDADTIERIINVNLLGTINMIKTFLPVLLDRPSAHIVNIASMGGLFPIYGQTLYGATKSAVKLLTEGLRLELADTRVGVTLIIPGGVSSNILKNSGLPTNKTLDRLQKTIKLTTPEKAAARIIAAMERGKHRRLVGFDVRILNAAGKISGRLPAFVMNVFLKKIFP